MTLSGGSWRTVIIAVIATAAAALPVAGCATRTAGQPHLAAHARAAVILRDMSRQLGRTTSLSMSLAMDVQQQQMRGMAMRGDITMRTRPGAAMAANLTMLMDGSAVATIREILVNNVAYLSGPSDFLPVSSGKRWTAVPAATLDQASGSSRASATDISLPQLTPTSLSGTFFASINAAKDVSVAGPQVIDGVPTTRLHGTYRDQGSVTTFDLWVDAQARPRELRESVSTDDANQGGMTLTVHFRSFNMPVSITPPPARDVGSMQLG